MAYVYSEALNLSHRRRALAYLLLVISSVFVLSAIGIIALHLRAPAPSFFPARIKQSVDFPLYYPQDPPAGLTLDKTSFSSTDQVVLYDYIYSGSKRLIVSIQPRTNGVDPSSFNPTKQFTTSIGEAYLVSLDTRTTAAIMGDKSWVLINAPDVIDTDTLTAFINSLKPAN